MRKKNKKKPGFDKFMQFWDSETTKNLLTIWAPILGFPVVVGVAEVMNRSSQGAFPNLKGNVATLYSATVVANLAAQVGPALIKAVAPTGIADVITAAKAKPEPTVGYP